MEENPTPRRERCLYFCLVNGSPERRSGCMSREGTVGVSELRLEHGLSVPVSRVNTTLTSVYPITLKIPNPAQRLCSKFQMSNADIACKPDR